MATLLVNSSIVLEKMTGKGGWTYALIPRMAQISKSPFGWVNVYGRIDGYDLKRHKLLSMGNGNLFLPVRADIRKKIKKEAGDAVHIILYLSEVTKDIPNDLLLCLEDNREALDKFMNYSKVKQLKIFQWLDDAKLEEDRVIRIAKILDQLE